MADTVLSDLISSGKNHKDSDDFEKNPTNHSENLNNNLSNYC